MKQSHGDQIRKFGEQMAVDETDNISLFLSLKMLIKYHTFG